MCGKRTRCCFLSLFFHRLPEPFVISSSTPPVRARSLDTLPIGLMGELGSAVVPRGALGISYNEWIPQKSETTKVNRI